jgi:hypothetical protein
MQPKPIDSRHLLDIDAQKRLVDMEGIEHLRSVREHKEHPAETDYDIIHDEAGRRNREETARQYIERLKKARVAHEKETGTPAEDDASDDSAVLPNGQKGSHLDIKA